jgi:hypothetical protein
MAVPLVPSAPLARVACWADMPVSVLRWGGSFHRSASSHPSTTSLADRQSFDWEGTRDPGSAGAISSGCSDVRGSGSAPPEPSSARGRAHLFAASRVCTLAPQPGSGIWMTPGSAALVEPGRPGVRSCVERRRASRSRKRPGDHHRPGARACSEAASTETTEPSVAERTTSRPSAGEPLTARSSRYGHHCRARSGRESTPCREPHKFRVVTCLRRRLREMSQNA